MRATPANPSGGLRARRGGGGGAPEETAIVGGPDLHRHLGEQRRGAHLAGSPHPVWDGVPLPPLRVGDPPSGRGPKKGRPCEGPGSAPPEPGRVLPGGGRSSQGHAPLAAGAGAGGLRVPVRQRGHRGEATARAIGRAAARGWDRPVPPRPLLCQPRHPDPDSQEKTLGHVLKACQVAQWMGGGPGGGPHRRPAKSAPGRRLWPPPRPFSKPFAAGVTRRG